MSKKDLIDRVDELEKRVNGLEEYVKNNIITIGEVIISIIGAVGEVGNITVEALNEIAEAVKGMSNKDDSDWWKNNSGENNE